MKTRQMKFEIMMQARTYSLASYVMESCKRQIRFMILFIIIMNKIRLAERKHNDNMSILKHEQFKRFRFRASLCWRRLTDPNESCVSIYLETIICRNTCRNDSC